MAIIRGTLGTTGGDLILAGAGNDTIFGDNFFGNGGGPLPPPYGGPPARQQPHPRRGRR